MEELLADFKRSRITIMLLLPIYEQVLTPIMGPTMSPSMLKSIIKETQQNPCIIDLVRQLNVRYWYNAGTSLERVELLSKETTIRFTPEEPKSPSARSGSFDALWTQILGSPKVLQWSQSSDGKEHHRLQVGHQVET